MKPNEQKKAAKEFAEYWKDRGYEKGESQPFWLSLLRDVFGVEHPEQFIRFEDKVMLDNTSFIDGFIPSSRVMIEQKSRDKNLRKGIKQSDGSILTPFQQAKRYITEMDVDLHPYYVITCNFQTFLIYNMHNPQGEPQEIKLADLEKKYDSLKFIAENYEKGRIKHEEELSIKAGEIIGRLYDALEKQYAAALTGGDAKKLSAEVRSWLNKLCVRLVFCFYAEDAGVFGKKDMFHDYLMNFNSETIRDGLIKLFAVLDTPEDKRDPFDRSPASAFPYVNGGLFGNCSSKEVPPVTQEIIDIILNDCCDQFDWSEISPTIVGALFESTLNQETRRSGGMHYTSIENIHKVIDPLFLNDLKAEYKEIMDIKTVKIRRQRLVAFQDKLASLTFLDPAAGSGNFLTETYISLRTLENEVLKQFVAGKYKGEETGVLIGEIKVSISQFYGIEINDFAVSVAKTALWIAESRMMNASENIIGTTRDFLPLTTNANIVEGNALRLDWKEIVPPEKLSYIMGNPPFIGHNVRSDAQKSDLSHVFGSIQTDKSDYVIAWFYLAGKLLKGTNIKAAFVATNSICQGTSVGVIWKELFSMGLHIDFAWRSFEWNNEAIDKAHVHVVIVGFSERRSKKPILYISEQQSEEVSNINGYLLDAPNICVERSSVQISGKPEMKTGSLPRSSAFTVTPKERDEMIKHSPLTQKWIRPYIGSEEFLNGGERYCLWMKNADPSELAKCPEVLSRVERVRADRLASSAAITRKAAETPTLFAVDAQPETPYIAVPQVSSERRRYIPIGFVEPEIIASNLLFIIPNATLYHFGVLTSNVHMAWMRTVAGRLETRYRYSKDLVYNNFPWPQPTPDQESKIEQTAQTILDTRAKYPNSSLADLYNDMLMPPDLRKAHQDNDKAVMTAYGFDWRSSEFTESDCVAELFKMYEKLVAEKECQK